MHPKTRDIKSIAIRQLSLSASAGLFVGPWSTDYTIHSTLRGFAPSVASSQHSNTDSKRIKCHTIEAHQIFAKNLKHIATAELKSLYCCYLQLVSTSDEEPFYTSNQICSCLVIIIIKLESKMDHRLNKFRSEIKFNKVPSSSLCKNAGSRIH